MPITDVHGLDIEYSEIYCEGEMEEIARRFGITQVYDSYNLTIYVNQGLGCDMRSCLAVRFVLGLMDLHRLRECFSTAYP